MTSQETVTSSPERKRQVGLILKLMAVFDLVLGVVIAVFGPAYVGGDASTDMIIRLAGLVFGAMAIVVFWVGHRYAARAQEGDNDDVVQRRRNLIP